MSNRKYAKGTKVSIDQSQVDILKLLKRYGVKKYAIDDSNNDIIFQLENGRTAKIHVNEPDMNDESIQLTEAGYQRTSEAIQKQMIQARKQMWRILLLFLKATLEAVDNNVISLDQAFLPHIILPNGQTMSEYAIPQLSNIDLLHLPQIPEKKRGRPKKTKIPTPKIKKVKKKSLQLQAWELAETHHTQEEIAYILNRKPNNVWSLLYAERAKRGLKKFPFVLNQENYTKTPSPSNQEKISEMTSPDLSKIIDEKGNLLVKTRIVKKEVSA